MRSRPSATCRCLRTSSGTIVRRTANATRPSSRASVGRSPRRPRAALHAGAQRRARRRAASTSSEITLHVGYGTFQPVRVDRVEDHRIEPEPFTISEPAALAINRARDDERRIIAVGTTTTRTLEAAAGRDGGRIVAGSGTTDLFIFPGFSFRVVRGPADQLSPAALVAAHAGVRVRRRRARARGICGGDRPTGTVSTATATRCWSPDAVVRSPFPPAGVAQLVRARVS